jgi:hypothetical protein
MVYEIKDRTKKIAKKLGVQVFSSDNPKYKLEVYDYHGNFITYVGASNYKDYPSYLEMESNGEVPKGYAEKRRRAYYTRHGNEIEKLGDEFEGSRSYYAFMLLWS